MKKFIAATLVLLTLLLTLSGCFAGPPEEGSTEEDITTQPDATEETTVPEETTTEEEETTDPGSAPVLYQIMPNCDLLSNSYLIKTRHSKYILIDGGGADGSGSPANDGYLAHVLREITGQTTVEIEAWFLTHLHNDHVTEFVRLSQNPRLNVTVNNIYLNVPSAAFMERVENGGSAFLRPDVQAAYDHFRGEGEFDKVNGKTAFTGDVIEIDGVKIEILMTVSDEETEGNINDTTLIFRVTMEGQTILFLGDANVNEGYRLLETYGDELKSDFVQMAHHGQNGVTQEVYQAINPTMCLWPSPLWVFENPSGIYKTNEVRGWMADLGVKYHLVAGLELTESLAFPVDFGSLEEFPIRKETE